MATENIKIIISAEDEATKVINQVSQSLSQLQSSFKDFKLPALDTSEFKKSLLDVENSMKNVNLKVPKIDVSGLDQGGKQLDQSGKQIKNLSINLKGLEGVNLDNLNAQISKLDPSGFDKIDVNVKGLAKDLKDPIAPMGQLSSEASKTIREFEGFRKVTGKNLFGDWTQFKENKKDMADFTQINKEFGRTIDQSLKPIKDNLFAFNSLESAAKSAGISMKELTKWQKQSFFTMDNGAGLMNALTGETISYGQAVQKATIQGRRFKMEWLSIMFAAMQLSRTFDSIVKAQLEMWGITAMNADMWATVMAPAMALISPIIMDIQEKIMGLPEDTQLIIGLSVLGLDFLSKGLMYLAEFYLAMQALKMLFPGLTVTFATMAIFLLKLVAGFIIAVVFIKGLGNAINAVKNDSIPGFINGIGVMVVALFGLIAVLGLLPLAIAGPVMIIFWTIAFVAANWKKYIFAMQGYWEMFGVGVMRVTVGIMKALNFITFGALKNQLADAESRLRDWEDALASTTESYHALDTKIPIFDELKSLFTTTTKTMDDVQKTVGEGFGGMTKDAEAEVKNLTDTTQQSMGNMTDGMGGQLDEVANKWGLSTGDMNTAYQKFTDAVKSNSGVATSTVQTEWANMSNMNVDKTKSTVNQINAELDKIKKDISTNVTTTHVIKTKMDFGIWDSIKELFDLPSYKTGGTIPETGAYMLHKGEKVTPKNQVGAETIIFSPTINATIASSYDVRELANELNKYWAQDFQRMMKSRGSV